MSDDEQQNSPMDTNDNSDENNENSVSSAESE